MILSLPFALTLDVSPATKKNSGRIVTAGRRRKILPSEGYARFELAVKAQCWSKGIGSRLVLPDVPMNLCAVIYRAANVGDLLNYLAAVSDALEAIGLVSNDKLFVSVDGSRMTKDADRPRVEILISEAAA